MILGGQQLCSKGQQAASITGAGSTLHVMTTVVFRKPEQAQHHRACKHEHLKQQQQQQLGSSSSSSSSSSGSGSGSVGSSTSAVVVGGVLVVVVVVVAVAMVVVILQSRWSPFTYVAHSLIVNS